MKTYGGVEYNFAILDLGTRWRGQLHATAALSRGKISLYPLHLKQRQQKILRKTIIVLTILRYSGHKNTIFSNFHFWD
jgi:hypothetical protein